MTLRLEDGEGRVLREETVEALAGLNAFAWDLLLDEALALEAEKARLADAEEVTGPADRPWAEALRLERPLYATPGSYKLVLARGGESAELAFEINAPQPLEPRVKPEPREAAERHGRSRRRVRSRRPAASSPEPPRPEPAERAEPAPAAPSEPPEERAAAPEHDDAFTRRKRRVARGFRRR